MFLASLHASPRGASLLSFSSPEICPQISRRGDFAMRIFYMYFSGRWSFLFPDTCLTQRRLSESYSSNRSQDFLRRVSPGLFSSLRNQCFRVLRDLFKFHNSHSIPVVAFFFLCNSGLSLAFCVVVHQPNGDKYLSPAFAASFGFVKLTLGRMPILTR